MSAYESNIGKDMPAKLGVCAGLGNGVKPKYAHPSGKISLVDKWRSLSEDLML